MNALPKLKGRNVPTLAELSASHPSDLGESIRPLPAEFRARLLEEARCEFVTAFGEKALALPSAPASAAKPTAFKTPKPR